MTDELGRTLPKLIQSLAKWAQESREQQHIKP